MSLWKPSNMVHEIMSLLFIIVFYLMGYLNTDKENICRLKNQTGILDYEVISFLGSSYNLENSIWNVGTLSRGPLQRYGHSLALYQVWILLFKLKKKFWVHFGGKNTKSQIYFKHLMRTIDHMDHNNLRCHRLILF